LVGTLFLVPLILAYTGYAYWVFRGKVRPGEGYHWCPLPSGASAGSFCSGCSASAHWPPSLPSYDCLS